jgi:N-acetylgalactosamine-N,N'-diacetylbacillosaminyl-diphospho-undecaprenol 4-alpha-N-acetylgalactosaminyltransferase
MKYILVIDHIATGGAERILLDYYHYLVGNSHNVKIFCLTGYEGQSQWTKGIDVVYGSSVDQNNLVKKTLQQRQVKRKLQQLVDEVKPDVVFSFLEKSNLLVGKLTTSAAKVMTVHNVLSIQYTKVKNPLVRNLVYRMIRKCYNNCPHVIAVSQQVKEDLVESFGVKTENVSVINNYVDREDIAKKAKEPIANFIFETDTKYILNIGRFSDQKAQWKLLKAYSLIAKDHHDSRLVLIGAGDNLDELKQLSNDLSLGEQVTFLPFSLNPYKYMANANLFVLSSIFEGFPIVLAEISSLRVPFVGSRKAVPEEMFADKDVWTKYIFNAENRRDMDTVIHDDEKALAKLLVRGLYDDSYRQTLLKQTEKWESHNDKIWQFKQYDAITTSRQK